MWIACNTEPILYLPEAGKMWLIDTKWDGMILKDCLIYKRGIGADPRRIKRGYEPHVFGCLER
jgi:hypothetical protein